MRTVLGGLAALLLGAAAYAAAASMPPHRGLPGPGALDPASVDLAPADPRPRDVRPAQGDNLATIQAACDTFHPYFAVSRFVRVASRRDAPEAPAIVAVRDSDPDDPSTELALATHGDVGAVYGLAYDAARGILYAGAYNKRATAFGPGGPGQVYAIDLATGNVRRLAALFGGRDAHDYIRQQDQPAATIVGRTSLADIDLDDTGATLFVMNMAEGKIYRLSTADGTVLGSFDHGGADYDWKRNARPFGLGFHDGWLYHGVVNSLEFSGGTLEAFVFRSRPDGSDMQEVVRIALRYPRYLTWAAWSDGPAQFPGAGSFMAFDAQPLLSDVEFLPAGELILGFRDRVTDMIPGLDRRNPRHPGTGDVIPVRYSDGLWAAITDPEFFIDQAYFDEAAFGALALLPGFPLSVSAAQGVAGRNDVGALWFWNGHGAIAARESIETYNYNAQRY
ncbi:MAG: hypothetical protein ACE5EL_06845, partial [Anaerolineae bacterium]